MGEGCQILLHRKISKNFSDLLFQHRNMFLHSLPNDCLVDAEIVMHQNVPHTGDFSPRDRRVFLSSGRVNGTHGFPDDHQVMHHPYLDQRTALKGCSPLPALSLDLSDGVQNVLEPVAHVSHRGTASRSTRSRKRGFKPSSVTRSTRQPRSSCKSSSKPPKSNREQPGCVLTSRSTSLHSVFSPRASEPNT